MKYSQATRDETQSLLNLTGQLADVIEGVRKHGERFELDINRMSRITNVYNDLLAAGELLTIEAVSALGTPIAEMN